MAFLGSIWKFLIGPIAGPILGVAFLATGAAWGIDHFVQSNRVSDRTAERDAALNEINAPGTGFRDRLSQCRTNSETATAALTRLAGEVRDLSEAGKASAAKLDRLMTSAAVTSRAVRSTADRLLAAPATAPPGSIDACLAGARILKTGNP